MYMLYFMHMKHPPDLAEHLRRTGSSLGWTWRGPIPSGGEGTHVKIQGKAYRLVLNAVPVARGPELERALADASLRAQRAAKESNPREIPLPIVATRSLSPNMVQRLDQYAEVHLGDSPWGAFDLAGAWHFVKIPQAMHPESMHLSIKAPPVSIRQAPPPSHDPFSDLGQWLSKVVLAQDLKEDLISAPRGLLRNQADLASAANVSLPTVSRWAKELRIMGFLGTSHRGFSIVRRRDFLKRWASSIHGRAYLDIWARPILGSPNRESLIRKLIEAEPKAILLGAEACHQLGIGVVHGAPLQIALPSTTPQDLERVGLQPTSSGEPGAVMVRVPKFPQSLRRGAVHRQQIPIADAIQCAVDAFLDPVRGKEQFEALLRVLNAQP